MNKLTKLLSVFVIAGAIGTGVAGVAGCNNGSKHTHDYEYTLSQTNSTKHVKHCKNDGHSGGDVEEDHTWEDGKCKYCKTDKPAEADEVSVTVTSKTTIKVGETIDLTATVAGPAGTSQNVTWAIAYGDDVVELIGGNKLKGLKFGDYGLTVTPESDATKAVDIDGNVINASKYDELVASADKIIDNSILTDAASLATPTIGTRGVYSYDGSSVMKIENGVASGYGGIYVDFGTTKDVIEGNVVMKITKQSGNGHTIFRLAKDGTTPSEIFGIKTNGKYRWNGGTETSFTGNNFAVGSDYEVTFKYNKLTNKISVYLGSDQGVVVYDGAAGFTDAVTGFSLHTKNVADTDNIEIKKVAVTTYDVSGEDYVNEIKGAVTSLNADAVALKDKDKGWTATGTESALSAAKTAADTALVSTATKEVADAALATYKTAVLSALSNEYFEQLKAAYPAANYNTGEGSAYDTAIAAAKTALDAVTEVSGFKAVYTAQDTEMKKVPDKAADTQESVVLELYVNDNGTETKIGTVNKNIDGGELKVGGIVKLSDLKTACTTAAGKCVGKIYTNAERTTELEITTLADLKKTEESEGAGSGEGSASEATKKLSVPVYTAVSGTEGVLKLYVTLGDAVSNSIDGALAAGGLAITGNDSTSITAASNDKIANAGTITISTGITGEFEANKARVKSAALGGYTACYETGGKSKASGNYIKLELTQACTITVKFADGKTNGGNCLGICDSAKAIDTILNSDKNFVDSEIEKLEVLAYAKSTSGSDLATLTYSFVPLDGAETTTLYLLGSDSLLFYDIIIGYEGAAPSSNS